MHQRYKNNYIIHKQIEHLQNSITIVMKRRPNPPHGNPNLPLIMRRGASLWRACAVTYLWYACAGVANGCLRVVASQETSRRFDDIT